MNYLEIAMNIVKSAKLPLEWKERYGRANVLSLKEQLETMHSQGMKTFNVMHIPRQNRLVVIETGE